MKYMEVKDIGGDMHVILEDGSSRRVVTWFGKSTWPKPKAADGVLFPDLRYEFDTGKTFVYDPETDDWTEQ